MDKEEKLARHYEQGLHYFYNELDLLFRRFNFFLVASSFLITSLAVLVTANKDSVVTYDTLTRLIYAVIVFGGVISVAFGAINYINAKVVGKRGDFLKSQPSINTESSLSSLYESVYERIKNEITPAKWLKGLPCDFLRALTCPLAFSQKEPASHTWVIPFFFYVLWMVAGWILLSWLLPVTLSLALLVLFAIYVYVVPGLQRPKTKVKNYQRYQVKLKNREIVSIGMGGHDVKTFIQPATKNNLPKLYVVKSGPELIYAGVTSQSIRNRLRYGLKAEGKTGYYGYKWRDLSRVDILIWCFHQESSERIEAVEAELVYLFRQQTGKWPKYQMEIHFHDASEDEKETAKAIFKEAYG